MLDHNRTFTYNTQPNGANTLLRSTTTTYLGVLIYHPEILKQRSRMRMIFHLLNFGIEFNYGFGSIAIRPLRPVAMYIMRRGER